MATVALLRPDAFVGPVQGSKATAKSLRTATQLQAHRSPGPEQSSETASEGLTALGLGAALGLLLAVAGPAAPAEATLFDGKGLFGSKQSSAPALSSKGASAEKAEKDKELALFRQKLEESKNKKVRSKIDEELSKKVDEIVTKKGDGGFLVSSAGQFGDSKPLVPKKKEVKEVAPASAAEPSKGVNAAGVALGAALALGVPALSLANSVIARINEKKAEDKRRAEQDLAFQATIDPLLRVGAGATATAALVALFNSGIIAPPAVGGAATADVAQAAKQAAKAKVAAQAKALLSKTEAKKAVSDAAAAAKAGDAAEAEAASKKAAEAAAAAKQAAKDKVAAEAKALLAKTTAQKAAETAAAEKAAQDAAAKKAAEAAAGEKAAQGAAAQKADAEAAAAKQAAKEKVAAQAKALLEAAQDAASQKAAQDAAAQKAAEAAAAEAAAAKKAADAAAAEAAAAKQAAKDKVAAQAKALLEQTAKDKAAPAPAAAPESGAERYKMGRMGYFAYMKEKQAAQK